MDSVKIDDYNKFVISVKTVHFNSGELIDFGHSKEHLFKQSIKTCIKKCLNIFDLNMTAELNINIDSTKNDVNFYKLILLLKSSVKLNLYL